MPEDGPDDDFRGDGLPRLHAQFDLSADVIRRSVEESLERLKLDSGESLYLLEPDVAPGDGMSDALNSALPAMVELKEQGVLRLGHMVDGAGVRREQDFLLGRAEGHTTGDRDPRLFG